LRWWWWKWNRNFSSLKLENWDKALVYYVFLHFFYFLLSFYIFSSMHCCFTIFSFVYRHTKKKFLILYTKFEQKFTEKRPNEIFTVCFFWNAKFFSFFLNYTQKKSLLFSCSPIIHNFSSRRLKRDWGDFILIQKKIEHIRSAFDGWKEETKNYILYERLCMTEESEGIKKLSHIKCRMYTTCSINFLR